MKRTSLLLFLSMVCLSFLQSQEPSKEMVNQMAAKVADLVKENYVLPEKGQEIAAYFLKDFKGGRFYGTKTLKQLDSVMCKSLREASNDYHLFVWNKPDIARRLIAEKNKTQQKTEEEKEEKETGNFFDNKEAFDSNFGFDRIEILSENIGYIKLSQINISALSLEKLYSAMKLVEHTKALVIDLRDNHGGGSTIGPVLETFFFDKPTDLLEFRNRNGKTEISSTVPWLLEKRYLKPLYLLTNKGTASAAEAFAFTLKHQKRGVVVGQASSGGAYMNSYFLLNEAFVVAISTSAPFLPGTTMSWEGKGVQPDYEVEENKALEKAIELISKKVEEE